MIRTLRRALAAAAFAVAALAPGIAHAQRSVPPLSPTAPSRPEAPARTDTVGLDFRVSQGRVTGAAARPTAPSERLSEAEAARLLARARPLAPDSAARDSFAFPARTLPPPRSGATVATGFPARDSAGPPPVARPTGLVVTRRAPEGEVPLGAEVTLTFSQPMVALSSVGNVQAAAVPARITPQAPGRWSWVDVRTLRFEPQGRLPMATVFTVEVPAGTVSATGGRLAEAVRWTFSTPAPRAIGAWPNGGQTGVQPVIVVAFDQRVSPEAVLATVSVRAGSARVPVRLATAAEVQADAEARIRVAGLEAGRWVAFRPVTALPGNTGVTVSVGPNTPSAEGARRTTEAQAWSFVTFGPLRLEERQCGYREDCRPGMPFVLRFSNPLADSVFEAGLVTVTPAIEGMRVSPQWSQLVISGRTRPNTRYTVRVAAGLLDRFGQRLSAPVTATFQVGAPQASLWTAARGVVVLDPAGPRSISVFSRNHARVRVRVSRVAPEDWAAFRQLQQRNASARLPGREVANQVRELRRGVDVTDEVAVDLAPALEGGLGQVVVAVTALDGASEEERGQTVYLWVQSTRIGLATFSDTERLTAWASSLVDGRPLDGVQVSLLPARAAATTGADGLATVPLPTGVNDEAVLLVARMGGDVAILGSGMGLGGWAPLMARPRTARAVWYAFTDRHLYRPGETVRLKGWLRRMGAGRDAGLTLPPGGAVDFRVRDSRGNEIAKGTMPLSALGGFDGSFAIAAGANLGGAAIELRPAGTPQAGNESFGLGLLIQEFRRPEYEVSVTADAGPHFVGGGTEVVARASYFSGGGLPGAPVAWRVTATPGFYSPPGWDQWSFGPTHPWWWWMGDDEGDEEVQNFSGVTDVEGAHAIRLDFDRARPPRPYAVAAEATVTDVNRQTWTSTANLLVHPSAVYLGMRTPRSWLEEGDTLRLELVALDVDGHPVPGRTVDVQLRRNEWRFEGGSWRDVEVGRESCSRVSATAPVRCEFPVVGGDYRVEATTTDAQGRLTRTTLRMWVAGPNVRFPGRGGEEGRTVEMIPDRERYAVGDTARILLRLPFQPVRGVVTIGREGVARTESFTAEGATHTLRIPITEADVPNVAVLVSVTGASTGGTEELPTARGVESASGQVNLRVPPATRTLTVRPVAADSVMLPDAEGAVEVEVVDAAGRPVAGAEVTLAVVDESVLALAGYRIPDPLLVFYPERDAGVNLLNLRPLVQVVVPDLAPAPGTLVGRVIDVGSGQAVGGARVTVQGTSLSARADSRGRFRIRGVPQGALTLIAEQDGYFGAAQTVRVGAAATPPLVLYVSNDQAVAQGVQVRIRGASAPMMEQSADYSSAPPPSPPPAPAVALEGLVVSATATTQMRRMAPGEAPPPIGVRSNFDPLALWMAAVRTDARGRVRVPFQIPSNLTRYRVTAVAAEGSTRFGVGEGTITARQPLMVRPSAPRFLNFGDRFELPIVLQNTTGVPMEVQVAARATGVTFTEPGRRVIVPANDRVEVRIPAEAVRAGQARFQVVASSSGATDAAEFTLPVYTPATAEAFATYGNLAEGAATLPLDVPTDVIPSFGGLEVTTSSTAVSELTDAFLYLVGYRFEGTEQVASRMIAVAALRDVLAAFNAPGLPSADSLRARVAADIQLLASRQNADGGFAWWERGRRTAPFASIHAAHALQRVREAGYEVLDAVWSRALGYLRNVPGNLDAEWTGDARRSIHAYALYTRQRMGDDVSAEARRLVADAGGADRLPLEAAGWLLSATARGPAEVRDSILRVVNNRATETASTATFATRYTEGEYLLLHSARRTDAVVLEGLLAADPRNPLVAKTVRGLLGNRVSGRWSNTQENAWVLLSVQRYFREYEAQTPDFVARVWLGDRLAASAEFRGRSATRAQTDVPMATLQGLRPESLTIGKEGTGRLYYRAGLRYAPRDLVLTPLERGFAVERTYEAADSASRVVRGEDGIWRVSAGSRVRVTVTMTAPSRRLHVALIDPLPAGWEPVNPELRGSEPGGEPPVRPLGRMIWPGTWWEHQNLRDDRAEAFTPLLPAGVYTYSYIARATTPGLFIVPPPRAEEMYSPETFGRGATERVIVQ